jgi:hypothetical protein
LEDEVKGIKDDVVKEARDAAGLNDSDTKNQ